MGSVRDLHTTGDNDPEIDPVQYYRHYLYCDACGCFDLKAWQTPHDEARERRRHTLAMVALVASLLVVVAGWHALGLVPSLPFLVYLVAGITLALTLRRIVANTLSDQDLPIAARWRFTRRALILFLVVLGMEWLANLFVSPLLGLAVGVIAVAGSLIWRWTLRPKLELFGMYCPECGAAYPYGTPFFTDLEANPLGLLLDDVPRPLGASPFQEGAYVGPAPVPQPHSRMPD